MPNPTVTKNRIAAVSITVTQCFLKSWYPRTIASAAGAPWRIIAFRAKIWTMKTMKMMGTKRMNETRYRAQVRCVGSLMVR